jgi:phosphatidylglycerophosphate synthase
MSRPYIEKFVAAYKKSMKPRGMDGPIDLFLYRPIGFSLAWLLSFSRASPNVVTLVSILLGLVAGVCALPGTGSGFIFCALFFQLSNCFDCADGQLARLTGRYTAAGRLIDGLADYSVNIFVFFGVLFGLLNAGGPRWPTILLVVAGGLSTSLSCMYYDRAITRFSAFLYGSAEVDELESARENARTARESSLRLLWTVYAFYLRLQEEGGKRARRGSSEPRWTPPESEAAKRSYSEAMLPLLSLWSFTGPSAHVLYFLLFALAGRIELYFAACVVLALVSLALLVVQQLVDLRLRSKAYAEE